MKTESQLVKLVCLVLLVLADCAACLASFLAGFTIRNYLLKGLLHLPLRPFPVSNQIESGLIFLSGLIIIIIFTFEKLYVKRYSFWEETRHLFKGLSLSFILIIIVAFLPQTFPLFPRSIIVFTWISGLIFFPLFRLAVKKALKKTGLWKKNVLILGTNPIAQRVAKEIQKNDTLCYEIAGFLSENPEPAAGHDAGEINIVGDIRQLSRDLCRSLNIQDIFIALPDYPQTELISIAKKCESLGETIKIVPDISSLYTLGVEIESVGDIISISVTRNLAKPWNILIKKTSDIILASFLILFLLPVFLLIAVAIPLDSRGPVFFSQPRLGRKKKIFRIHKFRSMYMDSDRRLDEYLRTHPQAREEWERFRKLKNHDPRVTRIGKWIRKWSVDELPQLFNVLKGEMSLVGPRPYLPEELDEIGELYQIIMSVTPGITGFWQIQGRNILTFKGRIFLDDYYIRNWSLWLDIVIILKTIKAIIKSEGAF